MPGNTENTDILTGINQVIEAINSLNTPTEVDGIIDKLERIRVAIVEDTAVRSANQSNDFYQLISAIQELTLSCQTIVNTTQLTQNISCGGSGTAGTGTWPEPESPQQDDGEAQAGDPPTGFDTWNDYHQYKCDMAYLILNQMVSDLSAAGLVAAGIASVTTLVPILIEVSLTPIGWAGWIVIGGLVIYCLTQGIEVSLLSQLILDNIEEFACELFSASSVTSSIGAFSDLVGSKVGGDPILGSLPEFAQGQVKQLIVSYASVDSFNRLYDKALLPPPNGHDCSACDEETTTYTIDLGEETSEHPANPIQVNYAEAGYGCTGNHHMQVTFSQPVTITNIVQVNTFGVCTGYSLFYYWDNPDTGTPPILATNGRPQDTGEVSGVRVLQSTTVADPSPQAYIVITYTLA